MQVIEAVHRNKPASQIPSIESFDLMYIRGTTPEILRESNKAPVSFLKVVATIFLTLSRFFSADIRNSAMLPLTYIHSKSGHAFADRRRMEKAEYSG